MYSRMSLSIWSVLGMWCMWEERSRKNHRALNQSGALVSAALEYRGYGWSVIPLSGKRPAVTSWKEYQQEMASGNEVESWWYRARHVPSGVGIVTGRVSRLVVVDCDTTEDVAYWKRYHPESPLVVVTGRGGRHFYYQYPDGLDVRSSQGVLGRRIDIRGEGGYATAPPSLHENGRWYEWEACDITKALPVFEPGWVRCESEESRMHDIPESQAVRNAVAYIRRITAVSGKRGHNSTFRAACKLRDAGLTEREAFAVLLDWNETNAMPPWTPRELSHKVASAFRAHDKGA